MRQLLQVIGDPLVCGQRGCAETASVLIRQELSGGGDDDYTSNQILYCEAHWIAARLAYSPIVARDSVTAVQEATRLLNGGNGSGGTV